MIDDDLKHATVFVALNDMIRRGSLSICTIDKCADILGIQLKGSEPYRLLSALHCVDFASMPSTIRKAVPEWISQCLNLETIGPFEKDVTPSSVDTPPPKQRTLLQRLLVVRSRVQ